MAPCPSSTVLPARVPAMGTAPPWCFSFPQLPTAHLPHTGVLPQLHPISLGPFLHHCSLHVPPPKLSHLQAPAPAGSPQQAPFPRALPLPGTILLFSPGTTPLQAPTSRQLSPAAFPPTGAVPPPHHSWRAPFPHGADAYRYRSPAVPPRPPGAMFHSAVPSRYLSPAVPLAPGTTAAWAAPSQCSRLGSAPQNPGFICYNPSALHVFMPQCCRDVSPAPSLSSMHPSPCLSPTLLAAGDAQQPVPCSSPDLL